MTTIDSPNSLHVQAQPHSASVVQVETLGRGVYAVLVGGVILASILAGMALIRTEATADRAALAEREARVSQERWNDLKVELARRGIPVSDH
jgi:hypothetical protein